MDSINKIKTDEDRAETLLSEYRKQRLAIATAVIPVLIGQGPMQDVAAAAVRYADALLDAFSSIDIGE